MMQAPKAKRSGFATFALAIGEQLGIAFLISSQGIVCAFLTQRLLSFRFMPAG